MFAPRSVYSRWINRIEAKPGYVRIWHLTDMAGPVSHVRFWRQSRRSPVAGRCRLLTQSGHPRRKTPSPVLTRRGCGTSFSEAALGLRCYLRARRICMRRRDLFRFAAGAGWPISASGQQRGELRRVGVLLGLAKGPDDPGADEILRRLCDRFPTDMANDKQ